MAYLSVRDGRIKPGGYNGGRLTPKMLSFINAYFGSANFNATEAAKQSDYKLRPGKEAAHNLAAELMNHPTVQEEIKRRNALREQKSELKAEFLIMKLMEIIESSDDEKTVDRLRAIELAGKSIALWKERQEISGPDGEAIRHEQNVKESVADFTSKLAAIANKPSGNPSPSEPRGSSNVVSFPERSGTSGA